MITQYRYWFLTLAVALCCGTVSDSLLARELLAQTQATGPGQSGFRKTGSLRKADTAVANIIEEFRAHATAHSKAPGKQSAAASFRPANRFVQFQQGMMLVEATASENGQQLMDELINLGMQEAAFSGTHVAGWLPVNLIETATGLASLQSLSATLPPIHNDYPMHPGDAPLAPQGDVALRADLARNDSVPTLDGDGITIAVISDSYDQPAEVLLTDAADDIASGDLPHHPIAATEYPLCGSIFSPFKCTDEGRAMMQIVHDLAPGATLMFHTGLPHPVAYANAINYLADPSGGNADIIVDDLSYLNEPMFQDGIIAQAVDAAVATGVGYYSAAGNQGRESYESAFDESVEVLCIISCDPITGLVGPAHDFNPAPPDPGAVCNPAPGAEAPADCNIDTLLNVTIPANEVITVVLQWDEPFGNVNTGDGPQSDLLITLLNNDVGTLVEISGSDNVLNGNPIEILQFKNDGYGRYACPLYELTGVPCVPVDINGTIVVAYDEVDSPGPPPGLIKLIFHTSDGVILNDLDTFYATDRGPTIVGHQNAAGAVAVGAAFYGDTPEFGETPPLLEPFSAAGGVPILFDINGTALQSMVIRKKPEIVAVDGVSTTFFSSQQVGDSQPDFFGTSAAAPHAAAVAALVMEANSSLPPWKIANALKTTAIDMETAGFDYNSGYGLIQADAAVAAAKAVPIAPTALDVSAVFASQVDLSWTDNSVIETGFDIERSPTGAVPWVLVGSTGAGVSIFSDTELTSNTPYYYRVKATYNSGNDSGHSNTVSATTLDSCPAGPLDIPSGVWHTFSLPCNPAPNNKVTDIFPSQDPAKYISHWIVYYYDAVNDEFDIVPVGGTLSEGVGYFVFLMDTTTVSISGSPFDPVLDIPLEADGNDMQFNLLGHNRNGYVPWPSVKIIDVNNGNAAKTLAEADPLSIPPFDSTHQCDLVNSTDVFVTPAHYADCLMSREMYKWNGGVYIMADGETLGLEGSLFSFDAFWVSALRSGIKLQIPPASLPPVPTSMAVSKTTSSISVGSKSKKPTAEPWFIRLIAESEDKQDPGNVLGQMKTSVNGQDRHDLKEKYPFDTRYLSILFTNPEFEQTDWGFTSDFRKLSNKRKGKWPFVVKASPDVENVTLRWEGDSALFGNSYLLDVKKGRRIKARPDGSYTFEVTGEESSFVFILK